MHGNVWEWVEDCYHKSYDGAPKNEAQWLDNTVGTCQSRVVRGGSWFSNAATARSAARYELDPDFRYDDIGFRVLCVSPIE